MFLMSISNQLFRITRYLISATAVFTLLFVIRKMFYFYQQMFIFGFRESKNVYEI